MRKLFNHSFLKNLLIAFTLCVPLLAMAPKKEVKWVAIGDSITYLNNHLNETGNRVAKGYLTRVNERLPYISYINKGYNGWTAVKIAQKIDELGLVKADIYTIFLGTNDWWAGLPLGTLNDYINDTGTATTCGSFRKIINKIHILNNDAKIVLITPMQRNDFVYINNARNNAYGSYKAKKGQWLEDFAKAIIAIGKYEHLPVIDLYHNNDLKLDKLVNFKRLKDTITHEYRNYKYPESSKIPFDPAKDEYPYPVQAINRTYDGLHPSDKGNKIIAKQVVKVFRNLL